MGSTRLPKKVLMELAGRPILWHMLDRLNKSKEILATIEEEQQKFQMVIGGKGMKELEKIFNEYLRKPGWEIKNVYKNGTVDL